MVFKKFDGKKIESVMEDSCPNYHHNGGLLSKTLIKW